MGWETIAHVAIQETTALLGLDLQFELIMASVASGDDPWIQSSEAECQLRYDGRFLECRVAFSSLETDDDWEMASEQALRRAVYACIMEVALEPHKL